MIKAIIKIMVMMKTMMTITIKIEIIMKNIINNILILMTSLLAITKIMIMTFLSLIFNHYH